METFKLDKIGEMNGKNGKPAYIVHDNKVYDVSGSKMWMNGVHMRIHQAGEDLSSHLPQAPHGPEVLERFPQVGQIQVIKEPVPEPRVVRTYTIFDRFPFLRRHPHPMVVHFPIALLISTTVFYLIFLVFGISSLETTVLHCLIAGFFFTPFGIASGYLTWILNYGSRPIRAVRIKIVFSWILVAITGSALLLRVLDPGIAFGNNVYTYLYSLAIVLFIPVVSIIGWYGGQLTIPSE